MSERHRERRPERRVRLSEAAELLGTSRDAVRMRVRRESLASEKGEDGRVYVFVEPDRDTVRPQVEDEGLPASPALVEELRDQVGYLREQLRREQDAHAEARRIIAALTARIPEIEAPSEAPGSPETKDWTQNELAEEAQVSPDTVVRWEGGRGTNPHAPPCARSRRRLASRPATCWRNNEREIRNLIG